MSGIRMIGAGMIGLTYTLMLLPVVMVILISFFRGEFISFPPDGLTTDWYANAIGRREFGQGFLASFEVALCATLIGVSLGTGAALALVRGSPRFRGGWNTLLLSPLAVPGIVAGTAIYLFYLGAERALDHDIVGTFPGLVAAHVLITIPWTVRVVSASLVGLDRAMEEASANLGARPFVTFWRITLPMARPGIVAACTFSFVQSFENLEYTLLLVGPGQTTLPIVMLNYLEFRMDPTLAAVATLQILVVVAAMLVTDHFVKLSRVV